MDYVDAGIGPALYRIKYITGKKIDFTYYRENLDKIDPYNLNEHFHIDQVIKKRKKEDTYEYLVTFKHQPKAFKRWLTKEQFVQ